MNKFICVNDIPDFPVACTQEEFESNCKKFVEAGAIPKKDLVIGGWYIGSCRNSSIAQWIGDTFQFIREKFKTHYVDTVNHFEDDDGYDVFIPIKKIEIE